MDTSELGARLGHLHGHGVGMGRDVLGRDQDRSLQVAHEIAGDGEDEVGPVGVHAGQEVVDHVHGDFRAFLTEGRAPPGDIVLVEEIRHLRAGTRWAA